MMTSKRPNWEQKPSRDDLRPLVAPDWMAALG